MKKFKHLLSNFDKLSTTYTDGKRYYATPEGVYPSITSILSLKKQKFIYEWRKRVGEEEATKITTKATRRGTGMHKIVEDYLQNKDDFMSKAMPNTIAMFKSIQTIIDSNIDIVHGIEVPLWSSLLQVAGQCDCVAEWDGKLSIVDWKTSSKVKKEEWIEDYFLQGTAYAIMYQERTGIPIKNVVIVIAVEDNEPQIFNVNPIRYVPLLKESIDTYYAKH